MNSTSMESQTTVIFADLTGSTALYESVGNEKATQTVTRMTQWIGEFIEAHGGRLVKKLGDGALGLFPSPESALRAMTLMQREHHRRLVNWPAQIRMEIKVGVASGAVVEVDGDCYGDAVNIAARLADRGGPSEIWASGIAVDQTPAAAGLNVRDLGAISVRGRIEALNVCRIDWHEEVPTDFLTVQAPLANGAATTRPLPGQIRLGWLAGSRSFTGNELPVTLGRSNKADVCIGDPRVSRLHARIEWRKNGFVLTDISSYGTWVLFSNSDSVVQLRREECLLHGEGEISLGVRFSEASAPVVNFNVLGSTVALE
ncbi:MAG: adenylate/guanylate cyclase domain-containing protein [Burkholderiales bacterium]